jgi:hypothetical protein
MKTDRLKKILIPATLGAGAFALAQAGIYANVFYSPLGKQSDDYHILGYLTQEQHDRTVALVDRLRARPYEPVSILSHDGLRLCGRYCHQADGAPLVILCHGYRGTPVRDFCGGADICFSEGFNVLLIEHRAHGSSEGHTISYGINESRDVLAWTEYAVRRFGDGVKILLAGISMGAATVLMASALHLPSQVRGILADCPYTAPDEIISKVGRSVGLPMKLLLPLVELDARVLGRFSLRDAAPLSAVREARVPILLIHGEADDFVPCEMSRRIAAANPGLIEFHTFPGAKHGLSYMADTEHYTQLVRDFSARIFEN